MSDLKTTKEERDTARRQSSGIPGFGSTVAGHMADDIDTLLAEVERLRDERYALRDVAAAAKLAADKLFETITLGTDVEDEERTAYKGLVDAVNVYCKEHCADCSAAIRRDESRIEPRPRERKRVGEYYHALDFASGLWCVFHTENAHAYASYASEQEAAESVSYRNVSSKL